MKKYLLSVFAAASMLFAASCSEEENFAESNKQSVTFKVEVEDAGASSRALTQGGKSVGEGSMIDRVHYAVYEASGEKKFLTKGDAVMTTTEDGAVGSVVIPLVNGLSFDIVFFAHNEQGSAFTIPTDGDLTELEFNTTLKANQESYDAFYFTLPGFQVTNSSTTPVTLKRAVAQLNVGTTEVDLSYADALKALATMSEITLTNVPTKFNARTGEVDDRTSVTFNASNILMDADWVKDASDANPYGNEMLENVKTSEGEKDFYYLAMAYVLAGDESALHDATFTFYRGAGDNKEAISERSLSSVRLQRNYRTNVTGNVLTQQEKFDVSLDINFGDEEHNYSVGDVVVVANEEQFEEVIKKNAEEENPVPVEIQLEGNITLGQNNSSSTFSRAENKLSYALKIDADQEITIDLNGFTISHQKACDGSYSMIENNGKLTILDSSANETGKIRFKDTSAGDPSFGWGSYTINNYGELIVEGGTIEHLGEQNQPDNIVHMICAIQQASGTTTINGGTISTPNYRSLRVNGGTITINDGNMNGQVWAQPSSEGTGITINGGTFQPMGGDFSSVFVENETYNVKFSVTGGTFNTKIGCSDANRLAGSITGGTFKEIAKNNTPEALLGNKYGFVANEDGTYDVKRGDYLTLGEFVQAVIDAEGNYDGQGTLVKIMVKGGDARTETIEGLPNRLQKYTNPEVYYAQYQRFSELADVNISNVNFEFVPAAVTVADAWNTADATTTAENINGELQFMNNGKVTLTNCTFNMMSVSPINAAELEITDCTFNGLQAYAIKDIKSGTVTINNNAFTNCNGGFWFADAPQSITANNNTFTQVGRRGAIQFSAVGDYTNSSIVIKDNNVEGAILWQLNNTVTDDQLKRIFEDNTYTKEYVEGSIQPVAEIGDTKYRTLELAVAAAKANDVITLIGDVTLTEELGLPAGIIFNGNGKQINGSIYAGGDLTFVGHTKVTAFSASYYNRTITIGEGACLEVTGTGRVTLGYGNTFNIKGSIEDAKIADKANVQPSLIIPGGISITGGNDAAFNVTNAYVKIGSTTSKPGVANGKFILDFKNSIVEFTKELGFYDPTGGMTPEFFMNITNSVFTTGTKLFVTAKSNVVVDNSTVFLGSYIRNSGKFELKNGSVLTGATIQFGENGGNNGTIIVDNSTLTVTTGNNKGNAFDGKDVGKIILKNNATASVEYYKAMTIECDATSNFTGTEVQ